MRQKCEFTRYLQGVLCELAFANAIYFLSDTF